MRDLPMGARTLQVEQTTIPPDEAGGEGYPMLKLIQDATATAVGDPEAMTIDLDELCRVAPRDAGRGSFRRAKGLPRGKRQRARWHR